MTVGQSSLLVAYLEAGDSEDYEAFARLLAPGVLTHSPGGSTLTGRDAQEKSWRAAHRGLHQLRHEVVELVTEVERIAARVLVTGVHAGNFLGVQPTGALVRVDQAVFARTENGMIAELWEIVDTASGLHQLGVLGDQTLSLDED